jgi:hypothetical protein
MSSRQLTGTGAAKQELRRGRTEPNGHLAVAVREESLDIESHCTHADVTTGLEIITVRPSFLLRPMK